MPISPLHFYFNYFSLLTIFTTTPATTKSNAIPINCNVRTVKPNEFVIRNVKTNTTTATMSNAVPNLRAFLLLTSSL